MPDLRNALFATKLDQFGDRLAVATPDGTELSYGQLAGQVADRAAQLGPERRLVQVAAANEINSLIVYLAALAGGLRSGGVR